MYSLHANIALKLKKWLHACLFSVLARNGVPFRLAKVGYFLWRNDASSLIWSLIFLLSLISCWDRLITPIMPSLTGITRPHKMSMASVPASIKSSLVITAKVLLPSGSTSLAEKFEWKICEFFFSKFKTKLLLKKFLPIFRLSEVAISALAADTARMIELGLAMNFISKVLIWTSMSSGWSPTGTLVKPRKKI